MKSFLYRGNSIIVCTRSMNLDLYLKSMRFVSLPAKMRIRNTRADEYIYKLLNANVDYVVNIDEDAFICNEKLLMELIDYVIDNKIVNCGMPDGGVVPIRNHNPFVTNPFFNILHVSEIRKKLNIDEVDNVKFSNEEYLNILPPLTYDYKFDDYESYYKIFIWIAINFKTEYLTGITHGDGISTILFDHKKRPLLYHSWYSRHYNEDEFHTKRINSLYEECLTNAKKISYNYLFMSFIEYMKEYRRIVKRQFKK